MWCSWVIFQRTYPSLVWIFGNMYVLDCMVVSHYLAFFYRRFTSR